MKTLKIFFMSFIASIMMASCQQDDVEPQLPALAEWASVYATQTQWWGDYYSPLVVTEEGKLFIAEHEIEYTFDEATNQLTFDWHDIKNERAKGSIVFTKKADGRMQFGGSINPRTQDGPVGYTGIAY